MYVMKILNPLRRPRDFWQCRVSSFVYFLFFENWKIQSESSVMNVVKMYKNIFKRVIVGHCYPLWPLVCNYVNKYFNHGNIEGTTYLLTMQVHAGCKKVQAKSDRHSYIHDCMRFT